MASEETFRPTDNHMCPDCGFTSVDGAGVCPHDGTSLVAAPRDQLVGSTFAEKYEVISVLGKGGMSVVYKARHTLMDKIVALKVLQGHLVAERASLLRFQGEAKAASSLSHANVIAVHDFGVTPDGIPFLVMDLVVGRSLADVLDSEGTLPLPRALAIFNQVCDALAHAHDQGVVHRDLKPSNIMLLEGGDGLESVKIVDFGLAKIQTVEGKSVQNLTQTGELIGSPLYMSPEQCLGQSMDSRSDIYSFGCVMYETLTGKAPMMGANVLETITRHVSLAPPSFKSVDPALKIPQQIELAVMHALEKDPANRPRSMRQVAEELDTTGTGLRTTGWQTRQLARTMARSKVATVLTALTVMIGLGCIVWSTFSERFVREFNVQSWQRHFDEGQKLLDEGDFVASEKALRRASEEAALPGDTQKLTKTLERLVEAYHGQGKGRQRDFAATNMRLGKIYLDQSDYNRAADALKRAYETNRTVYGDKQPETLASEGALGFALQKEGHLADAEPLLQAAYQGYIKLGGDSTSSVAASLSSLARLYQDQGKFAEAEDAFRRSRSIFAKQGKESPEAATNLSRLAQLMSDERRPDEASAFAEEALAMRKRIGGENNPDNAKSLIQLGDLAFLRNDLKKAEKLFTDAEQLNTHIYGADSPWVAGSVSALGQFYLKTGRYKDAFQQLNRALAIRERILPEDHPLIAQSLRDFARYHAAAGERDTAKELLDRALTIDKKAYGPDHGRVAEDLFLRGRLAVEDNDPKLAGRLFEQALAVQRSFYGPESLPVADTSLALAQIYRSQGQAARAEPLIKQALAIDERVYQNMDPTKVAPVLDEYAAILLALNRGKEAQEMSLKAAGMRAMHR